VVLDFLHRGESLYTRASQGHILSAGFGVILIGFAGFSLLVGGRAEAFAIGHVGLYTPIILLLYALAMRTVFHFEQRQRAEYTEKAAERYPGVTLRTAVTRYLMASGLVVSAGVWLPFIGAELAASMGWNNSFVGTLFVAFATSVPELVVTVSALRIGALDMAIGNLLGSNLFDVAILAVDDIFFLQGPILSHVSQIHVVSAISAIMMTGVAIVGLFYRAVSRLFRTVGWISLFLFMIYLVNSFVLFLAGE
jgi:cation:H+ antiporter